MSQAYKQRNLKRKLFQIENSIVLLSDQLDSLEEAKENVLQSIENGIKKVKLNSD